MDAAAIKGKLEEHKIRTGREIKKVKVGGFDIDGVLRGKYVSLDKFWGMVDSGFGFCDVIFGWDIGDLVYENDKDAVTGSHTGFPDAHAKIDSSTIRFLPNEPDTAAFLVDFSDESGDHPACPRSLLKRQLAKAHAMGFQATFSCE